METPGKALTLLLIDDDRMSLEMLGRILQRKYRHFTICCTIDEGRETFQSGAFDIVCVGLAMENEKGYHLVDEITAADPSQRLVTISDDHQEASSREGCLFCQENLRKRRIAKPINLKEFMELIDTFDQLRCRYAGQL